MITFNKKFGWYSSDKEWITVHFKDLTVSKICNLESWLTEQIVWVHMGDSLDVTSDTYQIVYDQEKKQIILWLIPAMRDIPTYPQAAFADNLPIQVIAESIMAILNAKQNV